jgi:thiol-disulfide isomerase/thioredoxin
MMKKIIFLVVFSSCLLRGSAQEKQPALTIGDTCPDVVCRSVLNYPEGQLKLTDFTGKMIILDFMATNCSACIAAFPHLEELQEQYKDKLQIIVVTRNSLEEWQRLTQKNKHAKNLKLPLVLNDTLLSSYFRYQYLPHEVWLDAERQVKAITTARYITASNIRMILNGQTPDWPLKKDVGDYDFSAPLLTESPETKHNRPQYYTVFTGHRPGTRSMNRMLKDSINNTLRWTVINAPVRILYRLSVSRFSDAGIPSNRFIYEVKQPGNFFVDSSRIYPEKWDWENTFCYEAVLPAQTTEAQRLQIMLEDLNRYTGYYGRKEKRRVPCYVIKAAAHGFPSLSDSPVKPVASKANQGSSLYPTISDLVKDLNKFSAMLPVLDETGVPDTLNIQVPGNARNKIDRIRKVLLSYGLQIHKTERELDVFVISEK